MAKKTMYLYGKNPVIERLKADPKSIRKILLRDDFCDQNVMRFIEASLIEIERVPRKDFMRKKHADRVQGVIAVVEKYKYASLHHLIQLEDRLMLVFLDSLNDPQNLGVIIRTLACLGHFALVIPEKGACGVTDTVLHVASGGENYVPICLVDDLEGALKQVREVGYWCVAAVLNEPQCMDKVLSRFPICVIMGSEAKGIRPELLEYADAQISLPMHGAGLSYNVAIATSLICYEISKRRMK